MPSVNIEHKTKLLNELSAIRKYFENLSELTKQELSYLSLVSWIEGFVKSICYFDHFTIMRDELDSSYTRNTFYDSLEDCFWNPSNGSFENACVEIKKFMTS